MVTGKEGFLNQSFDPEYPIRDDRAAPLLPFSPR
jgi:hypothetical protein